MTTSGRGAVTPGSVVSVQTVGNPAAGAQWGVAAQFQGLLVAVNALFTCDAVVANRVPILQVHDGSGHLLQDLSYQGSLVASQTVVFTWGIGLTTVAQQGNRTQIALVPMVVSTAFTVGSLCNGMDPGDTWTNISLVFAT